MSQQAYNKEKQAQIKKYELAVFEELYKSQHGALGQQYKNKNVIGCDVIDKPGINWMNGIKKRCQKRKPQIVCHHLN